MALFTFNTINAQGAKSEGVREAADKFALARELKAEGLVMVSAEEVVKKHSVLDEKVRGLFGHVSMREKIMFARNVGAMLEAGLALSRILSVIERQSRNAKLKEVVAQLNAEIRGGKTFNDAMRAFPNIFSPLFISMVKAGEESGNLASSLKTLSSQMEKNYLLQKRIKGALIYPSIIICFIVAIGVLMMIYVVPTLTNTFKELKVALPWSTRLVIGVSDFLRYHGLWALLVVLGAGGALWGAGKNAKARRMIDFAILKAPFIGNLVKESNSARTARTLASLLSLVR